MFFSSVEGNGKPGRLVNVWNDCLRDDLAFIGKRFDWWRKCRDRGGWKATIENLLLCT